VSTSQLLNLRCCLLLQLVMLRNKPATGHTIPLLPLESSKVRGIAVVGPNSVAQDACTPFGGDYCICQRCATNHTIGIFEGLRNYLQLKNSRAVVSTSPGCTLSGNDTSEFAAAEALMRSDHISHVVVAVGLSGQLEGEGSDRVPSHLPKGILLPGRQQELLDLAASIGKPLILVVVAGGATPVSPSVNITAEFAALYPGLETGNAFASILFGESSPAGRLPFSIPATVSQLGDYLNFSMSTKPFGRTFSWMQGSGSQQLHEYGFGLSYGKWAYSKLAISPARLPTTSITAATDAAPPISVVVTVYNHGQHTSDEVVQVYSNWTVHDPSQMRVPVRQLVAFSRLRDVKPGETRTVTIYVRSKHYALVDSRGERVLPEGELTVSVGGSQPTSYSYRAGATHAVSQTLVVMATGT
jgi:beta-glucosidase